MKCCFALALAATLSLPAIPAAARPAIRQMQLQFPKGQSGSTVKGTITGGAAASSSGAAAQAEDPMGQCDLGAARAGGGTAVVVVTPFDCRKRMLMFSTGKAIGADLSQADGDMNFRATKEAYLFMIRAGKERYELPEAVIFGG
jgi:hypothetical protein